MKHESVVKRLPLKECNTLTINVHVWNDVSDIEGGSRLVSITLWITHQLFTNKSTWLCFIRDGTMGDLKWITKEIVNLWSEPEHYKTNFSTLNTYFSFITSSSLHPCAGASVHHKHQKSIKIKEGWRFTFVR